MAKVTGPLMSMEASGQFGKSMVFGKNKGRNVVRQFTIPANPKTAGQGDQRIMMGGLGRSCGKVGVNSPIDVQLQTLGVIPSDQSKQSYLVKYIKDHYLMNAVAYGNEVSALAAHTSDALFEAAGTTLGIVEFDLAYATITPFTPGLGVYLLAKAAIDLGFTGAPYTTALASWTSTQIDAFVLDFSL